MLGIHESRWAKTMAGSHPRKPKGYDEFLRELKIRVKEARVRAALAVNSELVRLYWGIGRDIPRNLKCMKGFAQAWPDEAIVQQLVALLPWGHNVRLLDRVKDPEQRVWYAKQTIENGWSRNMLVRHVERGLFEARGGARTNFEDTLPAPQSDLARETLKDPYKFDFLGVGVEAEERVIEGALVRHIRNFLLELGQGFAFVVIELKTGRFRPEFAGKLNFYLSPVDDLLRLWRDEPTHRADRRAAIAELTAPQLVALHREGDASVRDELLQVARLAASPRHKELLMYVRQSTDAQFVASARALARAAGSDLPADLIVDRETLATIGGSSADIERQRAAISRILASARSRRLIALAPFLDHDDPRVRARVARAIRSCVRRVADLSLRV